MKQVVIIGGGVVGLATAYYAARNGHSVALVERSPEQRDGCSFGNAGMIVPSHFVPLAAPGMVALGLKWMWNPQSPFYVKPRADLDLLAWSWKFWRASTPARVQRAAPLLRDLHLASRACFEEFATLPGVDFGLTKKGLIMLCRTRHALDEEGAVAQRARSLGIPADVLDARQTAALEPEVRMSVAGSVHFPLDCHLSPHRFMAALKQQCDHLGVRFLWNTPVERISHDRSRVTGLRTPQGGIVGDEYVLCAGAWSPGVVRDLSLKMPMQAGKGYSLTLSQPRQLPGLCAILTEARVAVTPMGTSLRFGGTMELSGLNESINPARVRGIINSVADYYPDFTPADFEGTPAWCGLRPCSPDGLPYLGRTVRFSNLCLATGHAMMGLSLGPVSGRLIAEILSDEKPSIPLTLLNPDRYG